MADAQLIPPVVRRAAAILPRQMRERYVQEWSADWGAAVSEEERRNISQGITVMAFRARFGDLGATLFGSRGIGPVIAGWGALVMFVILAGILGGPVGLLLVIVVLLGFAGLAKSGLPTHGSHWSMAGGVVLTFGCLGYVLAVISAGVDAADAGLEAPSWTNWIAVAGIGLLSGIALFIGGAATGYRRRRRKAADAS